ncbi:hypothetical protein Pcinc_022950 [Petrolisthes cinctipes]|uniref:Uncharacterized protein n=1 Tax=Petrolisthes cinctipes TaxID=88211 RepID=A0AAE1FGS5_PETCI|nr:hypothetical protein Pcinc_022950 [Petrolisthes cinctipes]
MKEASESEASLRSRSRVSLRSHGWTTDRRRCTARSRTNKRQKRASSLPPSSTLSLQSVTTAESSGIGLSRASSMTSVASTRHRTFYTRQRARSLGPGEEDVASGSQRSPHTKTKISAKAGNASKSQGTAGSRKHQQQAQGKDQQQPENSGWKHKCLAAWKHARQHRTKTGTRQEEKKQKGSDWSRQRQEVKSGSNSRKSQQQTSLSAEVEAGPSTRKGTAEHQKKSHPKAKKNKERKEQGSQTRLSGPQRPRRMLLVRSGKNKVTTSDQQDDEQAGISSSPGNNSDQLQGKRGTPETQEQTEAGHSRRQSHNKVSPELQEARTKSSLREESSISRSAKTTTSQNQQPRTIQEQKQKSGKALDIAKRATQRWIRATSKDSSQNKDQKIKAENSLAHSKSLDYLGQGNTQHYIYKNKSASLSHFQQSSTDMEKRSYLQIQQEPERLSAAHTSRQHIVFDEPPSNQRNIHRRSSMSVERRSYHPSISPVTREHKRSRSIDVELQTGASRSRDRSPNVSLEVREGQQPQHTDSSMIVTRQGEDSLIRRRQLISQSGNDCSDYDFEDNMQSRRQPNSSTRHKTVEVQVDGGIERSSSPEDITERRHRVLVDQGRIVESQGSRRQGNYSENGRFVEVKGSRDRGGPGDLGRPLGYQDNRYVQAPTERRLGRSSMDGLRLSQSVDLGSPEDGLRPLNVDRERVRREPYTEYVRYDPTTEYSRHDVPGRGVIYGDYSTGLVDRGYGTETLEPRYARVLSGRRYTVGPADSNYVGSYAERSHHSRPVENDYARSYFDRSYSGRPYDNEYSRVYVPGRIVENGVYPERILTARRLKSDEDWERGRIGDSRRYREAIIGPQSTSLVASSPTVDHRAL